MEYEYYRNESVIEGKRQTLYRLIPKLQECITEWNSLNVGEITTALLSELIYNSDSLLLKLVSDIIPNPRRVGGFAVNKNSLLQTLELPSLTILKTHTAGVQLFLRSNNVSIDFYLIEDGKVKISEKFLEIIASNTANCRNENEKELVMLTERILEGITELHTKLGADYTSETYKLLSSNLFRQVGSDWFVNPSFISQYSHIKLNGKVKNESTKI